MATAKTIRVSSALLPLSLTPILLLALTEGYIEFGGGEKDILFVLPWTIWSLIFAGTAFMLWWRRWSLMRSLVCAFLFGAGGLLAVAAVLALTGSLGLGAFAT
jgi:hypothetical protein